MTDQNNAAAENTAADNAAATPATKPWVNRFGTLQNVRVHTGAKGEFVTGQMASVAKDTVRAPVDFIVFNEKLRREILKRGNGQYISMRGEVEEREMDGGKYTRSSFKGIMLNVSKAEAEAAKAAAEGRAPEAGAPAGDQAASNRVNDDEIPF